MDSQELRMADTIEKFTKRLSEEKLSFVLRECLKESWKDNNLDYFSQEEKIKFKGCYAKYSDLSRRILPK